MSTRTDRSGFTLIELLIVVIVIGILAAIAIPRFSSARDKSFRATMMADLKNLAHQQEVYHNANFTFSADLDVLEALESQGVTLAINEADGNGWAATAVHSAVPNEQCGIYHGDATPANGAPASQESIVQCSF
jgi:type II secretion system protein G